MQFEQATLFDTPLGFTYNQLDSDGRVYCKVDWLTVVFFDTSMNHVLKWLHLGDCVSDFCSDAYQQSRGYDDVFKFRYNGILLETSSFNYYGHALDTSVFDIVVPKLRLDISGSGLDFLRSIGVDMNSYRFNVPALPEGGNYHFTRCDFAFDFINYKPEFVDRLIQHIQDNALPSGRVPLASTKGAIGCKVVTCNQKTVYLGSPQSDRMLRVYDKRMEQMDLQSQTYRNTNPYNNPDSWFRIEWQVRNRFCNDLVQDRNLEFKHILKLIFDKYAFAEGNDPGLSYHARARSVVDFWNDLFDWSDLESRIVQNAKYVMYESPDERLVNTVETVMIRTFLFWASLVGREGVQDAGNRYLRSLRGDDPVSRRRYVAFLNKLNQLSISGNLPSDPSAFGLVNIHGSLYFNFV